MCRISGLARILDGAKQSCRPVTSHSEVCLYTLWERALIPAGDRLEARYDARCVHPRGEVVGAERMGGGERKRPDLLAVAWRGTLIPPLSEISPRTSDASAATKRRLRAIYRRPTGIGAAFIRRALVRLDGAKFGVGKIRRPRDGTGPRSHGRSGRVADGEPQLQRLTLAAGWSRCQ